MGSLRGRSDGISAGSSAQCSGGAGWARHCAGSCLSAPHVDFNMKGTQTGACCKIQNHKHQLLFAVIISSPALLFLLGKSACVYLRLYTCI